MGAGVKRFLFDTNILIYYFADVIPAHELYKIEEILKTSFQVSIITKIEFFGFETFSKDSFTREEEFFGYAAVIPLTDDIADIAIDLRRKYKVKLPDAIIAATCILNNFTLITRNEKDFAGISELDIYNPFP